MSGTSLRSSDVHSFRTEYERGGDYSLSVDVARAVATVRGENPVASSFVLADWVDTDVLDALARSPSPDWSFQFLVANCVVTVDGEGTIAIDAPSNI